MEFKLGDVVHYPAHKTGPMVITRIDGYTITLRFYISNYYTHVMYFADELEKYSVLGDED